MEWAGDLFFNRADRFKMGSIIPKFVLNRHIVCFQEVHGTGAEFLLSFPKWLLGWLIARSDCFDFQGFPAPGSGGVVTAIYFKLRRLCSFEEKVVVPGRCLLVTLCSNTFGLYKRVHIVEFA